MTTLAQPEPELTNAHVAETFEALNAEDRLTVLLVAAAALEVSAQYKILAVMISAAERCLDTRTIEWDLSHDDEL